MKCFLALPKRSWVFCLVSLFHHCSQFIWGTLELTMKRPWEAGNTGCWLLRKFFKGQVVYFEEKWQNPYFVEGKALSRAWHEEETKRGMEHPAKPNFPPVTSLWAQIWIWVFYFSWRIDLLAALSEQSCDALADVRQGMFTYLSWLQQCL